MAQGKTIVVTGGLGHIGSALIRSFGPEVSEVRIIDNLLTQRYASLFDLPDAPKIVFYEEDILKADLEKLFSGADVVVHLAAITDAAGSFGKEDEVEAVNFEGVKRVADACQKTGARLLFPSSTSVYGSQASVVDETCTELQPQSPYADSKLKAEAYLKERAGNLRFVTCRFGTIFGWSVGMRFHTAVNKFIWQAVNGAPITVWKTAWEQKRPYLSLSDCVEAIHFIIEHDMFDGELYNVVTKNFAVKDIVETIQKFVPDLKVTYVDSPIMNQLSYDVASEKIAKKGFSPKGDIVKGIEGTITHLTSIAR